LAFLTVDKLRFKEIKKQQLERTAVPPEKQQSRIDRPAGDVMPGERPGLNVFN
jgi:hypothetical protein